jgi:predicted ATPase
LACLNDHEADVLCARHGLHGSDHNAVQRVVQMLFILRQVTQRLRQIVGCPAAAAGTIAESRSIQEPVDMAEAGAVGPDMPGEFPTALTSLVGRQQETAAVRALLLRRSVRLVTLTGPAGVGKTRLAVQVAAQLRSEFESVAFVSLVSIREPVLLAPTIARALGVGSPDDEIIDALRAYLRPRSTLLVLDNFEHLVHAGPELAELLRGCPELTLLVTSRVRLRISGEHVVGVPPLSLPDPDRVPTASTLARYDAVRLFVERSQAADPGFTVTDGNAADLAEVCRRLDGLPLAIELAAARSAVLPPAAMLARLDRRLPMLTNGPRDLPERLRTLRAGIEWSYDLLSPAQRGVFRRLAVFAGGCSLAAAEFVTGQPHPLVIDLVGGLVDSSLVQSAASSHAAEPRFTMLETIREYALEQLAVAGEDDATRRAHAAYFCELAEEAAPRVRGAERSAGGMLWSPIWTIFAPRWTGRCGTRRAGGTPRSACAWPVRSGTSGSSGA